MLYQNVDFWHENSNYSNFLKIKYSRISFNFGAKIQISLKVKLIFGQIFDILNSVTDKMIIVVETIWEETAKVCHQSDLFSFEMQRCW